MAAAGAAAKKAAADKDPTGGAAPPLECMLPAQYHAWLHAAVSHLTTQPQHKLFYCRTWCNTGATLTTQVGGCEMQLRTLSAKAAQQTHLLARL